MLRGCARVEVFAPVFSEAGRNCVGGDERDAGVFAARGGGNGDAEQEAACGVVPARGGGRTEHRSSLLSAELLTAAADDCDSAAAAGRKRCGDRPRWIFRAASEPRAIGGTVSKGSVGDRTRGGFARSDAIAL